VFLIFSSLLENGACLLKITSTSVTRVRQCNEYYYMSTDRIYNLDFSLVYKL